MVENVFELAILINYRNSTLEIRLVINNKKKCHGRSFYSNVHFVTMTRSQSTLDVSFFLFSILTLFTIPRLKRSHVEKCVSRKNNKTLFIIITVIPDWRWKMNQNIFSDFCFLLFFPVQHRFVTVKGICQYWFSFTFILMLLEMK